MLPDTASTAPETNASAEAAPTVDSYGFPLAGDVSTENMDDAELSEFVDKTLGIKSKGSDHAAKTDEPKTEKPEEPAAPITEPPAVPAVPPEPAKVAEAEKPVQTAETPPVLDTSDLWIEVENNDGAKVKLTLDDGIPEEFQFKSDKQLYDVLDSFTEMKQLRAERQRAVEKYEQDQAAKTTATQSEQATMADWDAEIQTLIESGALTAPKVSADDPKFLQDPSVQTVDKVFKYMVETNTKRTQDGKTPIKSFALAYNLYTNDEVTKTEAENIRQKNELAKKRGAIIGGTSAPAGNDKGYVYKRGSARSIWQVDTSDI